jgi:hypothetical protein
MVAPVVDGEELAGKILRAIADPGARTAIEPPGAGAGFWSGGPSAVFLDGEIWLAYRLRRPVTAGRGYANVVARSTDGYTFETVATVTSAQFASASLERPALVPLDDGGWRLYVSCSTEGSKHWWVEAIDSPDAAGLAEGKRTIVLPGDEATAWKDVVVQRDATGWHMWACRHPLDGGDDQADRMTTWYANSDDGLMWDFTGPALEPVPGTWNQRGARVSSVLREDEHWIAFYDGRASAAENWRERTGTALGSSPESFEIVSSGPAAGPTPEGRTVRYLSIATMRDGYQLYWEATREDGAQDLRSAYVPRT